MNSGVADKVDPLSQGRMLLCSSTCLFTFVRSKELQFSHFDYVTNFQFSKKLYQRHVPLVPMATANYASQFSQIKRAESENSLVPKSDGRKSPPPPAFQPPLKDASVHLLSIFFIPLRETANLMQSTTETSQMAFVPSSVSFRRPRHNAHTSVRPEQQARTPTRTSRSCICATAAHSSPTSSSEDEDVGSHAANADAEEKFRPHGNVGRGENGDGEDSSTLPLEMVDGYLDNAKVRPKIDVDADEYMLMWKLRKMLHEDDFKRIFDTKSRRIGDL